MIALFDEPPRISLKESASWAGREGLLVGLALLPGGSEATLAGIVVVEDGSLTIVGAADLVLAWRYEAGGDKWVDVNNQANEDQPG